MTSEMILEDREEEPRTHITERQKGKAEKSYHSEPDFLGDSVEHSHKVHLQRVGSPGDNRRQAQPQETPRVLTRALEAAQGFGVCVVG